MRKLLTCSAILACAACQQTITNAPPTADTAADAKAIEALEKTQMAAFEARDAAAASGVYSSDAVFIGDQGTLARGQSAITDGFKTLLADPAAKVTYSPGAKTFSAGGDMAYATADYTLSYTDSTTKKPVTVKGTNLSVWRKQADGSWKLVADSNPGSPGA